MLYPTDPVSVRQMRHAALADAEHDRQHHRDAGRRSWWSRLRRRRDVEPVGPFDPALEPFAGLDQRTLRRLAEHFTLVDLDPGDSMGRQGETRSEFVIVLSGRVGVTIDGVPVTVLDAGAQFGALPLLEGGAGRATRASFDVLEHSQVAIADRREFLRIIEEFPVVGDRIKQIARVRKAYLDGHADGKALEADRVEHPFPLHLHDSAAIDS